jgi:hypothetical protein
VGFYAETNGEGLVLTAQGIQMLFIF